MAQGRNTIFITSYNTKNSCHGKYNFCSDLDFHSFCVILNHCYGYLK